MKLVKDSRGCNLLHEDIQSKLMELLGSPDEEAGEEEDALARFLIILLCRGESRAMIEKEINEVMPEELGPSFVDWCALDWAALAVVPFDAAITCMHACHCIHAVSMPTSD